MSLFSKIDAARNNRDIVCAAPEAIKSLMLKAVEALERLESFDFNTIRPNESNRNNREVSRLRDQLASRSDVADEVFRVLNILKSKGILIMDEVSFDTSIGLNRPFSFWVHVYVFINLLNLFYYFYLTNFYV